MALNFGKLDFSTAFNRTSAFPLDARSYFESLTAAQEAAASAEEAGSTNTTYYFGQVVSVVENNLAEVYVILPSKTLKKLSGDGGSAAAFYVGYYKVGDGQFYTDSTYQTKLPKDNTKLYIDLNSKGTYRYYGEPTGFVLTHFEPAASEEVAGILKLYNTTGGNIDGTMTQKAINNGVAAIKLVAKQFDSDGDSEITDTDDFYLELQTPGWSVIA